MSTELLTEKRIPPSLKGTIYQAFIESVSEEIKIFRDQIGNQKTNFYSVEEMDKDRLIQISENFGVPFSTIVKDDLTFLRQEVNNIGFKLFYKGTPTLYRSFFPSVDRIGQMFIYTYSVASNTLQKSMETPYHSANNTPKNKPFLFPSKNDFSGKIEDYLKLDTGLILDDLPPFKLDAASSLISTNHIGFEYFIDRLIVKNGQDYLMTDEYLGYLVENIEWGRRCKEVPHIGSQLSIQTDLSGLTNYSYPTQEYSVPDLKLNVVARPDLMEVIATQYDIQYVKFGIGKWDLPSVQNPSTPIPTDLKTTVATSHVNSWESYRDAKYIGASGEYGGQEIKQLKTDVVFDNLSTVFSFTLPLAPIRKGNVCLAIVKEDDTRIEVLDDRKGHFSSPELNGSINYDTGHCILTTNFEYYKTVHLTEGFDEEDPSLWEFTLEKDVTNITPGSIKITYTMGEGAEKKTYRVTDNGSGAFPTSASLLSSSIDYATGEVVIHFSEPLTEGVALDIIYSYAVSWVPEATDKLYASYFFVERSIDITEVGFFDKNDTLLIYATFPPMQFSATDLHGSFTILVDTTEIT